jgi:hypothetical protein
LKIFSTNLAQQFGLNPFTGTGWRLHACPSVKVAAENSASCYPCLGRLAKSEIGNPFFAFPLLGFLLVQDQRLPPRKIALGVFSLAGF